MQPDQKQYNSVQEMLDDVCDAACDEMAEEFRKREPYRNLVAAIRKWWSFDDRQQHTHSWHDREDFIDKALPELVDAIVTASSDQHSLQPVDDDLPLTCQGLVDRGWTERPFGSNRHFDYGDITLVQVFGKTMPTHWEMQMRGFEARMSKVPKTIRDVRALEQLRKDED